FEAWGGFPEGLTDRLCRVVLLGLLPAASEGNLPAFGQALETLQREVGQAFAPFQGGPFAHPALGVWVDWLRRQGLHGVGQSSWGPTLYGFTDEGPIARDTLLSSIRDRFGLDASTAFFARPQTQGATLESSRADVGS